MGGDKTQVWTLNSNVEMEPVDEIYIEENLVQPICEDENVPIEEPFEVPLSKRRKVS